MRVAIAGGSGFIGSALTKALLNRGDKVTIISRNNPKQASSNSSLNRITWEELAVDRRQLGRVTRSSTLQVRALTSAGRKLRNIALFNLG